ncbi:DUF2255 family protein [Dactylosporangium sp. CA-139066]|uniref:DUF2255 family protein n=1 Tax=Dactylosporangium sp. CA-139066 TaxID=3239930 RepID=UPI003D94030B
MNAFAGHADIVLRVQRGGGSWSVRRIWVVLVDDDAYIRSAFAHRSGWYRSVCAGAAVEIEAAGTILPVRLEPVNDPELVRRISKGYREKYALSWPGPVETITGGAASATTMRVCADSA